MSEQASFPFSAATPAEETTGRYVITFADDQVGEGLSALAKVAGVSQLPNTADFATAPAYLSQMEAAGGAVFPTLGVAVVTLEEEALQNVMLMQGEHGAILDIEPERIFYALGDGTLPLSYLRGYLDAVTNLYEKAAGPVVEQEVEAAATYVDDSHSTWGLKATNVMSSRWTGQGIKVAVLDTGVDMQHPDLRNRIVAAHTRSFYPGEPVQDRLGHGSHCIGTACGNKDAGGRRYGVAGEAEIWVGKVLGGPLGSGPTAGILAGIEWAINAGCDVISLSLGNREKTPSTAYTQVGRRALERGCLIVAAAGNHYTHGNSDGTTPGTVAQPANSPSILAVGALNSQLGLVNPPTARFSCTSGVFSANVDLAAPGVAVYSSVPMPKRYDVFSGTSMATPHVAGIAALFAQASGARGWQLWQLLVSRALRLPIPNTDAGGGLAQAPD